MPNERAKNRATLKWIYALSEGQRGRLWVLTIGRVLQGALFVTISLFTRGLIDGAVAGDRATAIRNGCFLLGAIVISIAMKMGLAVLLRTIERRIQMRLRMRTYGMLENKKQSALNRFHSGELLDRVNNDTPHVVECLVSIVPDLAGMTSNLIGALGAMYIMSSGLTMILVGLGLLVAFSARFARRRIRAYYREMRENGARMNSFYLETLTHSLLIKVFGAKERANERAKKLEGESFATWRRWLVFHQTIKTGSSIFFQLGYFGALILGANALFRQALSYGTLTAILQLVSQIQDPFAEIGYMTALYNTSLAAAERMIELENLPDEPPAINYDTEAMYEGMTGIRAEKLTFGYGDETVIRDCDFFIRKGDLAIITGLSGAGKSTLEKLMLGVYDDYEGRLCMEKGGESIPLDAGARSMFSYVPQGDMVISGTIMDNLTFLLGDISEERLNEALEMSCADEFVKRLPQGVDTPIGEHGTGLSEGQNQRLAIARALLSDRPILLMDEPTSALDADTEARILRSLSKLKDKTIILISHKEAAFAVCDTELRLENGQITQRRLTKQ